MKLYAGSFLTMILLMATTITTLEAFDVKVPRGSSSPSSSSFKKFSSTSSSSPSSSLSYRVEEPPITEVVESAAPKTIMDYYFMNDLQQQHRDQLKKELAIAAIENYDMDTYFNNIENSGLEEKTTANTSGNNNVAEDIMKKLELANPWYKPAYHPDLNSRWSFVFTGVPTIGMRLITLLSRISVGFGDKIIDFRDVFLEVSKQNTQVKAIVAVKMFGVPIELNVFTTLEPKLNDPKGTFLIETFQKLVLNGIEIPTPSEWKSSRDLEITYLDQDMMIARTAGGEPHLLLRHSPCSTDDIGEECDIDMEVTEYFQEARSKYGSTLSRSLVDRAYTIIDTTTSEDDDDDNEGKNNNSNDQKLDIDNIVRLIKAILQGENGH